MPRAIAYNSAAMGGDTCSAFPERLKTYGHVGQTNDQDLAGLGRKLSGALAALAGSDTDPGLLPRMADWGGDLQRFATRKAQIDAWVGAVGDAFEKAAGGTFDANTEVFTSASNIDSILAQDPRVAAALQLLKTLLGNRGWVAGMDGQLLQAAIAQLHGMTPEQVQEVFWNLSDDQLKQLGVVMALPFGTGVSLDERNAFIDVVLSTVDPRTMTRLMADMPDLEPDLMTHYLGHDYKGFNWSWQASQWPLWGPTGLPDPVNDINQGDDGDCWFLAGLGAVALTNPALLQQHIRANPNGTYTVTFYKDGKAVEITVTDDLPYGTKGGSSVQPYAHPGSGGADWAQIYEKAYAEFRGGYSQIDGGFGDTSMADLTGQHATRRSPSDLSLADVQQRLQQGYAITTG
ncbi:MAG TPA: C2 family cysteine protease, partial [Candidatus Dormibacteraeota bacterium]|nr:C2 family cysteine protease [Candidatus Dormibacteraeota bacterium]